MPRTKQSGDVTETGSSRRAPMDKTYNSRKVDRTSLRESSRHKPSRALLDVPKPATKRDGHGRRLQKKCIKSSSSSSSGEEITSTTSESDSNSSESDLEGETMTSKKGKRGKPTTHIKREIADPSSNDDIRKNQDARVKQENILNKIENHEMSSDVKKTGHRHRQGMQLDGPNDKSSEKGGRMVTLPDGTTIEQSRSKFPETKATELVTMPELSGALSIKERMAKLRVEDSLMAPNTYSRNFVGSQSALLESDLLIIAKKKLQSLIEVAYTKRIRPEYVPTLGSDVSSVLLLESEYAFLPKDEPTIIKWSSELVDICKGRGVIYDDTTNSFTWPTNIVYDSFLVSNSIGMLEFGYGAIMSAFCALEYANQIQETKLLETDIVSDAIVKTVTSKLHIPRDTIQKPLGPVPNLLDLEVRRDFRPALIRWFNNLPVVTYGEIYAESTNVKSKAAVALLETTDQLLSTLNAMYLNDRIISDYDNNVIARILEAIGGPGTKVSYIHGKLSHYRLGAKLQPGLDANLLISAACLFDSIRDEVNDSYRRLWLASGQLPEKEDVNFFDSLAINSASITAWAKRFLTTMQGMIKGNISTLCDFIMQEYGPKLYYTPFSINKEPTSPIEALTQIFSACVTAIMFPRTFMQGRYVFIKMVENYMMLYRTSDYSDYVSKIGVSPNTAILAERQFDTEVPRVYRDYSKLRTTNFCRQILEMIQPIAFDLDINQRQSSTIRDYFPRPYPYNFISGDPAGVLTGGGRYRIAMTVLLNRFDQWIQESVSSTGANVPKAQIKELFEKMKSKLVDVCRCRCWLSYVATRLARTPLAFGTGWDGTLYQDIRFSPGVAIARLDAGVKPLYIYSMRMKNGDVVSINPTVDFNSLGIGLMMFDAKSAAILGLTSSSSRGDGIGIPSVYRVVFNVNPMAAYSEYVGLVTKARRLLAPLSWAQWLYTNPDSVPALTQFHHLIKSVRVNKSYDTFVNVIGKFFKMDDKWLDMLKITYYTGITTSRLDPGPLTLVVTDVNGKVFRTGGEQFGDLSLFGISDSLNQTEVEKWSSRLGDREIDAILPLHKAQFKYILPYMIDDRSMMSCLGSGIYIRRVVAEDPRELLKIGAAPGGSRLIVPASLLTRKMAIDDADQHLLYFEIKGLVSARTSSLGTVDDRSGANEHLSERSGEEEIVIRFSRDGLLMKSDLSITTKPAAIDIVFTASDWLRLADYSGSMDVLIEAVRKSSIGLHFPTLNYLHYPVNSIGYTSHIKTLNDKWPVIIDASCRGAIPKLPANYISAETTESRINEFPIWVGAESYLHINPSNARSRVLMDVTSRPFGPDSETFVLPSPDMCNKPSIKARMPYHGNRVAASIYDQLLWCNPMTYLTDYTTDLSDTYEIVLPEAELEVDGEY